MIVVHHDCDNNDDVSRDGTAMVDDGVIWGGDEDGISEKSSDMAMGDTGNDAEDCEINGIGRSVDDGCGLLVSCDVHVGGILMDVEEVGIGVAWD